MSVSGSSTSNRADVLRRVLAGSQLGDEVVEMVALLLVDAVLESDVDAVSAARAALVRLVGSSELVGPTASKVEVLELLASLAEDRLADVPAVAEPGSHSEALLLCVAATPGVSNSVLAEQVGVDKSVVSRVLRGLAASGVVVRRRVGRTNRWSLTPRGVRAVAALRDAGRVPLAELFDALDTPTQLPKSAVDVLAGHAANTSKD